MRIQRLHLKAYGPFTDVTLDFSAPAGMHVVYGPNEAGKSTALRALTGLLYGIPARTQDAHRHRMNELRVGGTLVGEDGRALSIVRRKGVKNTLTDADDAPMDDAELRRMLGGVSEETFRAVFGLDHETLRRGAEALLEGRGELGETLFGAGLGGRALRKVLEQLRAEVEEIWTPQARKKRLNEALHAYQQARDRARIAATDPMAVIVQRRGLDEALAARREIDTRRRELAAKKHRLLRAERLLPLLARREALRARRAEVGEVPALAPTAAREREDAQRERTEARAELDRLTDDAAALEQRVASLSIPRALLDDGDAIEALPARLGAHEKAREELPRLEGELARLEADLSAALRRAGRRAEGSEVPEVDAALAAKLRKLSLQHEALEERTKKAREAVAEARAGRDRHVASLASWPAMRDGHALRSALERARRRGDLAARLADADVEATTLGRRVEAGIAALGVWRGSASELVRLPLPSVESVEQAERERAKLEQRRERAEQDVAREEERLSVATRELDALARGGHVPSEAELVGARKGRDHAFEALREALSRGAGASLAQLDAYGIAVRHADELSDRLRREAERVGRLARLEADRDDAARRLAAARAEQGAITIGVDRARLELAALFAPANIDAPSIAELRGFLARHATLRAHAERLEAAELARDRLASELGESLRELAGALEVVGEPSNADGEELADRVDRAARVLESMEDTARSRRALEAAHEDAERAVSFHERALGRAEDELAAWKAAWAKTVVAVGLAEDASPEEASAALAVIVEASRLGEEARRTRARIDALRVGEAELASTIVAIVARSAPDLAALPVELAGAALSRRHREGLEALAESFRIERALAEHRAKRRDLTARAARAEAKLEALLRAACAADDADLERIERLSDEARELDRRVAELDDRILELGEGASVSALAAEVDGLHADAVAESIEQTTEALTLADDDARRNDVTIGSRQEGLARYDDPSSAASEAAEEAESHLARVRDLASRWARVRIASVVLEREIERYRERHQGPVLARASEICAKLTRGSVAALRAGFGDDDEPVLRCVREGGREVGVEGLSDGTRDQLYLALRLATLERHAATSAPMPLVVDDVLIHFDDERAGAALEALAELGARSQVLFFTHHARLVELARAVCREGAVAFHSLG